MRTEHPHEPTRKITVNIPTRLLEGTKMGTTELIREALEQRQRIEKQRALLDLFGKVKFDLTYAQLKEER